jgi:D-glycero-D-manno-heptose 1,7-bisphosphate phosphatase
MTGRALFLDRDGVINVDHGYVHRPANFEFVPGVFDTARAAARLGYSLIVVTNQAGIARGYYTVEDFEALTAWMCERFASEGAPIAAVYYCPYHADGVGPWRVADHPDRKPNAGMLLRAIREHALDPRGSVLLGDQESDVTAARRAGLGAAALFAHADPPPATAADAVVRSHAEAVAWLEEYSRTGPQPG